MAGFYWLPWIWGAWLNVSGAQSVNPAEFSPNPADMGPDTRRLVVSAVAVLVSGFFSMPVASGPIDYSQCRDFNNSLTISVGQNVTLPKLLSSDLFKLERLWPLEGLICELVNGNMKQNYLKCVYGNLTIILINMQISDSGVYLFKNGFGPGICLNISVTGDSFRTTSSTPQDISKKSPSTHSPRSRIYTVITILVSLCGITALILYLYC
ncbi:uncharacterized protein LOC108707252 [Xenopus laevis]|uniref:Uncharacterized protein LOC108707252 n=2 Tax=Xenopus laevis TaxID=8355 RepID=A0A1L8HRB4_XENLA|nr:uncharacterized protein LOC108707252 [Xenopus laevis]OCT98630.1 hypothetical protein XELAEV_18010866mg [Xenopus laevis]